MENYEAIHLKSKYTNGHKIIIVIMHLVVPVCCVLCVLNKCCALPTDTVFCFLHSAHSFYLSFSFFVSLEYIFPN